MDYTQPTKEYVFGDERPFASCHASTLVLLPDGSVLAAWFGGSKEGADDVAIWCARREGGRWSTPLRVSELEGVPHWNPVLFQADGGPIHLYYKVGRTIPAWQTWVRTSKDGSHTWSASRPLVEGDRGGRGPVKNKPIRLLDGTWLAPASIEGKKWDAFVDISHDRGQSWTQSEIVPLRRSGLGTKPQPTPSAPPVPDLSFQGKGVIQPTLWESEPNNVHAAAQLSGTDPEKRFREWGSDLVYSISDPSPQQQQWHRSHQAARRCLGPGLQSRWRELGRADAARARDLRGQREYLGIREGVGGSRGRVLVSGDRIARERDSAHLYLEARAHRVLAHVPVLACVRRACRRGTRPIAQGAADWACGGGSVRRVCRGRGKDRPEPECKSMVWTWARRAAEPGVGQTVGKAKGKAR